MQPEWNQWQPGVAASEYLFVYGKGVGVRSKCYTCQSAVRCVYDMRHYANLHFKFAVKRGVPDTHNALKAVCVFGSWCA